MSGQVQSIEEQMAELRAEIAELKALADDLLRRVLGHAVVIAKGGT